MFSATTFSIRDARVEDVPELVRLGWAALGAWPSGHILVGEINGVVAAAMAIDGDRSVGADMPGVPQLMAHMRARVARSEAWKRTPSPRSASASAYGGR